MVFPFQIRPHSSDANNNNSRFLAQNIALAKKNSFLMSKIAGLESKISELIQENIDLRALNAKNEDNKRRNLEEKLSVIEEGVAQRFEDMLQMFSTIRQNEGLPVSQVSMQTIMRNVTGEPSTSEKTVSFDNVDSPKKNAKSERRRKSARRQSIYIAPPSPPPQQSTEGQQAPLEAPQQEDISASEQQEEQQPNTQIPVKQTRTQPPAPLQHSLFSLITPQLIAPHTENIPLHFDDPNPFDEHSQYETSRQNLSEFLIPEEEEAEQRLGEDKENQEDEGSSELFFATSMSPIKFGPISPKKNTFQVFEDSPKPDELKSKIQRLATEAVKTTTPKSPVKKTAPTRITKVKKKTNNTPKVMKALELAAEDDSDQHKPLEQDTSKIKHTNKKNQKSKSTTDEKMPESSSSSQDELLTGRSRRSSRGQQVSYTEPSLRAKMRRQSAKFVDAIVDGAFVRPASRSSSVKEEETSEANTKTDITTADAAAVAAVAAVATATATENEEPQPVNEASHVEHVKPTKATDEYIEASRDSPTHPHKPLTVQDSENVTKRRKPLSSLSKNKIQKTNDKLFKKSVLDELSVFDLVEESSVGVPKTYKGTPDISTRRKSLERRHSTLL